MKRTTKRKVSRKQPARRGKPAEGPSLTRRKRGGATKKASAKPRARVAKVAKRPTKTAAAKRPAKRAAKAALNRRASPDVVEKRRAARAFNDALLRGGARGGATDGRTERRRRRLLKELAEGAARSGKRELKPIDVLARVEELIRLGEPIASIRKACPRPRRVEGTKEVIEGLRRLHRAYTFSAAAYRFVGIDAETLRRAGVGEPRASRRGG